MLFIAERNAGLAAGREYWALLCAIANGLESTRPIATRTIETFFVICHFLFLLVLLVTIQITQQDYVPRPAPQAIERTAKIFFSVWRHQPNHGIVYNVISSINPTAQNASSSAEPFALPLT
jgi:hypothetical protein